MQATTNLMQSDDRSMRVKEAAAYLGIGKSTFWLWVSQGKLPKGHKLSERVTFWLKSEIDAVRAKAVAGTEA